MTRPTCAILGYSSVPSYLLPPRTYVFHKPLPWLSPLESMCSRALSKGNKKGKCSVSKSCRPLTKPSLIRTTAIQYLKWFIPYSLRGTAVSYWNVTLRVLYCFPCHKRMHRKDKIGWELQGFLWTIRSTVFSGTSTFSILSLPISVGFSRMSPSWVLWYVWV